MKITFDDAYTIVSYIKNHERENIPEEVWELCQKLCEYIEDEYDNYEDDYYTGSF